MKGKNSTLGADARKSHVKVGIFWWVDSVIIGDAVPEKEGEPYGDALQHGGHHEFWEKLIGRTEAERKFKSHAYDYYPRGRMVLFPERQTARLYVDCCMDATAIDSALEFFDYAGYRLEIERDDHYRCARCNRRYLE